METDNSFVDVTDPKNPIPVSTYDLITPFGIMLVISLSLSLSLTHTHIHIHNKSVHSISICISVCMCVCRCGMFRPFKTSPGPTSRPAPKMLVSLTTLVLINANKSNVTAIQLNNYCMSLHISTYIHIYIHPS